MSRPPDFRRVSRRSLMLAAAGWTAANGIAYYSLSRRESAPGRPERPIDADALEAFVEREAAATPDGNAFGRALRYRLMGPPRKRSRDSYPVLLFLHGSGQRGVDNLVQLRGLPEQMAAATWRSRFPCFFLAPQCPPGESWTGRVTDLRLLLDVVLSDRRADRGRVYVTGLSMGGFGAWALAAAYPELYAAAVPICGGGDSATAASLARVPIWAIHGDADEAVPVERSREMVAAVRAAGGDIRYSELAGVGHDSWTATYADPDGIVAWMFRQRRAT